MQERDAVTNPFTAPGPLFMAVLFCVKFKNVQILALFGVNIDFLVASDPSVETTMRSLT